MPAKKEVKVEVPVFIDEEGSYVHELEQARYKGGVRRYTQAGGAAASAGLHDTTNSSGVSLAAAAGAAPSSSFVGVSNAIMSPAGGAGTSLMGSADGGATTTGAHLYRHGRGTYSCPSFTYDGTWEEDEMHGSGRLKFHASGNLYEGDFARGCFNGVGTYRWKDGAVYVGQWRANRMHGEGIYTDVHGRTWKGRYYNGSGPGLIRLYPTLERVERETAC